MTFPKKKQRKKMGVRKPSRIDCPGHLQWIRNTFACTAHAAGTCEGKNEAHHATTRGAGGGDEKAIPLCFFHHGEVHNIGRKTFEEKYKLDLLKSAEQLWKQSPHRIKYERDAV